MTPELAAQFPLLRRPAPPGKGGPTRAAVILVTSNRGLAGAFNANLIKEARRRIEQLESEGYTVDIHAIGKKGAGFFSIWSGRWPRTAGHRRQADRRCTPRAWSAPLIRPTRRGSSASVDLVYAKFVSALTTPPTVARILPVEPPADRTRRPRLHPAPDPAAILEQLLPLYVRNMIYRGLVETVAGEQGARRTAMKNATDNAGEIIEYLTRTYNRQRQAAITQEISEIVGGAAALGIGAGCRVLGTGGSQYPVPSTPQPTRNLLDTRIRK